MNKNMLISQTKAETLRLVRSPFFLLFSILMPLAFYFLFSALSGADKEIESTTYAQYSLMSMTAFSLISTAMSQFGIRISYERRDGWVRLLKLTPLTPSVWIGSKMIAHMGVHLLTILVIFSSAHVVYHMDLTMTQWLLCGLWLWLGSTPFLAIGALLGTMKNADAVVAIANVVQMAIAVLGGLWMPLQTLPKWIQHIGQWLPSHRYAHGAWNMLSGSSPAMIDWAILIGTGIVFMALSGFILNKREAA